MGTGVSWYFGESERGCVQNGVRTDRELRLGAEGLQRVWIGILVNYKLEFNYVYWLIYGKEMEMYGEVAKHNMSVNSNIW